MAALKRSQPCSIFTTIISTVMIASSTSRPSEITSASNCRSVAAAKKARELADRNLDAERKKFDNGMTTSFTVAQVQNDLTTARSNELLAIAGYLKSMVSWHRAIGDLLSAKNVEIAGLPKVMQAPVAEEGTRP